MEAQISIEKRRYEREVEAAQSMFNRVLVCWASDVLELRRQGALVPRWTPGPGATAPSAGIDQGGPLDEPMNRAA